MNPRFPLYIVSKGRWKRRPTTNFLEAMNCPYYMIVEKEEYAEYAKVIDKKKLLILPKKYLREYDTFWPRTVDNKTGPGPARNYAWDHSIKNGFKWHWVLDDNIESLERFNNNLKVRCNTPTPFYVAEDFVLRYTNLVQAGFNYAIFCPASEGRPPIKFNTRIYSCLLIKNDIPFRWRGRYNEDTDLSLRILKAGLCTVQFNAFLIGKRATQTVKGGNTKEFYTKEGTEAKSQMLVDMHPDVAKLSDRFNRIHHHVDYTGFATNKLKRKPELKIPEGINDYGMKLEKKAKKPRLRVNTSRKYSQRKEKK